MAYTTDGKAVVPKGNSVTVITSSVDGKVKKSEVVSALEADAYIERLKGEDPNSVYTKKQEI